VAADHARLSGLQHPGNLVALTDEEMLGFDEVFIPNGQGCVSLPGTRFFTLAGSENGRLP
jgi:hypothetical protein